MEPLIIGIQLLVALGIYNVWLLRREMATSWRGGAATNIREEFAVYGLPSWFVVVIGFAKVLLATLLVAGVWYTALRRPAAAGIALLMLGAVLMHVKVRDPIRKALPALALCVLSLIVVFA